MTKKRRNKLPKSIGLCRDCKKTQPVPVFDWSHASNPRCLACGGMLDRVGRKRNHFKHAWGTAYR